jgi:hypothetical protein
VRRQKIMSLSREHRTPPDSGRLFFQSSRDAGLLRAVADPAEALTWAEVEERFGPLTRNEPQPGVVPKWAQFYGPMSLREFAHVIGLIGLYMDAHAGTPFFRAGFEDNKGINSQEGTR